MRNIVQHHDLQLAKPEVLLDTTSLQKQYEEQWAVFFEAWGLTFQRHSAGFSANGIWRLPNFYLPENRMWVALERYDEELDHRAMLTDWMPFVHDVKEGLIILFDGPELKAPEHQGWALREDHKGCKARPIHLVSCIHCGKFATATFGTSEAQKRHPGRFRESVQQAKTDILLAAYEKVAEFERATTPQVPFL